jgi:hypothetical protein
MAEHLGLMSQISLSKAPFLFGVGTIENAYDRICNVTAVPAGQMVETDRVMLVEAKAKMPRILFDQFDLLIVDEIGKNISGDGMDPNITGRYPTPYASGGPEIAKVVILDLTEATHGNANGMGVADFITRKLFDKIDYASTYANGLTSTVIRTGAIPAIFADDRDAILGGVKTCGARDQSKARVVRIKDTLHMGELQISQSMLAEAEANPMIEVVSAPTDMQFDANGNLL